MEILTKRLGNGQIKWGGIVIPRNKTSLFPPPDVEFGLWEGETSYKAKMDNQSRLRVATWFRQHPSIKQGDEVTFRKEKGKIYISLSKNFSKPVQGAINWAQEVIEAIKAGEIHGIIRLKKNGFEVEIGEHIKETQITTETKQIN